MPLVIRTSLHEDQSSRQLEESECSKRNLAECALNEHTVAHLGAGGLGLGGDGKGGEGRGGEGLR